MLADGEVRYVGDAVAAVVAETRAAAQDAAEAIMVDCIEEPLPAVTDLAEAVRPAAPAVWPDLAPDNKSFLFRLGDAAAVEAAFARAAHIARLDFRITRVSANPLEPRNALASHDAIEDRYTLITGTQLPHVMRNEIAEYALGVPVDPAPRHLTRCRRRLRHEGRAPLQEQVLTLHAAKPARPPSALDGNAHRRASLADTHGTRQTFRLRNWRWTAAAPFLALKGGARSATPGRLYSSLAEEPVSSTNNVGGLAGSLSNAAYLH